MPPPRGGACAGPQVAVDEAEDAKVSNAPDVEQLRPELCMSVPVEVEDAEGGVALARAFVGETGAQGQLFSSSQSLLSEALS